jgi:hypothetical protein
MAKEAIPLKYQLPKCKPHQKILKNVRGKILGLADLGAGGGASRPHSLSYGRL